MRKSIVLGLLVVFGLSVGGAKAHAETLINGAGATFPYPLYSKWFAEYGKLKPQVKINYQSIGSGGGIRQFQEKTIDFGASDAPMTDEQLSQSKEQIIHIPTVLGAVVLTYNLPETKEQLNFTSDLIADVFMGKVTKWNDPRIKKINPSANLPDTTILVIHRSDGSGTTNIFTDYMAKVSPEWKDKIGAGTSVNWPLGLGGKGNEGVAGLIKQTEGTIGYVELIYAESNKLPVMAIQNKSGTFVVPSVNSVTAAAAAQKQMPEDFRVSITNADGKDSYPLSSFTYLLIYNPVSGEKGRNIVEFLKWAIKDGQKFAEPLAYAPLPSALVTKVEQKIMAVKVQ